MVRRGSWRTCHRVLSMTPQGAGWYQWGIAARGCGRGVIRALVGDEGGSWCPLPPIAPEALLLPDELFPEDWRVETVDKGRSLDEWFFCNYDAVMRDYLSPVDRAPTTTSVRNFVARYRTEETAHRDFLRLAKDHYDNLDPWPEMEEWAFAAPHANEYGLYVAFREREDTQIGYVSSIARYGRYVSDLVVVAHLEDMTLEQVQALIVAADEQFAEVADD